MVLGTGGNCKWIRDLNCLIEREDRSCVKCISLMYYNFKQKKCVPITHSENCLNSSGESDSCQICFAGLTYFENSQDFCEVFHFGGCIKVKD